MGCRELDISDCFIFSTEKDHSAAHFEYSPFGKIISENGSMPENFAFRFSSEYNDSETGLVYYNYRYYDANMGRWINRDPIGEDGGDNLYGFVGNDGVNRWDYLGLKKIYFTILYGYDYPGAVSALIKDLNKKLKTYTGTRKDSVNEVCLKKASFTMDHSRKALEEGYGFIYTHGGLRTKKNKGDFGLYTYLKQIPRDAKPHLTVADAITAGNPPYRRWLSKDSQAKYKAWAKRKRAWERNGKISPGSEPKTYTKEELANESLTENDFIVQIQLMSGFVNPEKILNATPTNPISKELFFYGCWAGLLQDTTTHGITIKRGHDLKRTVDTLDIDVNMEKSMKSILDKLSTYKVK